MMTITRSVVGAIRDLVSPNSSSLVNHPYADERRAGKATVANHG